MGVYGISEGASPNWIGLSYDLDWTPEMKNGKKFFGRDPSLRVSSFEAICNAMHATGLSGIGPNFMADANEEFELLQPKADQRTREIWMLIHETRKGDAGIRNTCKWIEQVFAKLS